MNMNNMQNRIGNININNQYIPMNNMMNQINKMNQMNQMNQMLINQQKIMQAQMLNKSLNNKVSSQNPESIKIDSNNINIIFIIVSEDDPENEINRLVMQIKTEEKVNEIFIRYLSKIDKKEDAIKKYIYNGNEISKDSSQSAHEANFTHNCIIKAIKSETFDQNSNKINNTLENNNTSNINNDNINAEVNNNNNNGNNAENNNNNDNSA